MNTVARKACRRAVWLLKGSGDFATSQITLTA